MLQLGMKAHSNLHQRLGAKLSNNLQHTLGQKKRTGVSNMPLPPPTPKEAKGELER